MISRKTSYLVALALLLQLLVACEPPKKLRGGSPEDFPDGHFERISIFEVLANPYAFSERHIEVQGYLSRHNSVWKLFPTPDYVQLYDLPSTIAVNLNLDSHPECDGAWASVKGVTKPFIGGHVEFDPEKIHYVGLSLKNVYCYATDDILNSKGELIIIPESGELPEIEEPSDQTTFQ